MKNDQPDRWVDKPTALQTLADLGKPVSTEEFVRALSKKFRMNGLHRGWMILDRLWRQNLVRRDEKTVTIEYEFKARNGSVRIARRPQKFRLWSINQKGRDRLRFLRRRRRPGR